MVGYMIIFEISAEFVLSAWLNIIAVASEKHNKLFGIKELLQDHYSKYGRSFFSRYDYEEVSSEGANALVAHINDKLKSGTTYTSTLTSATFTVSNLSNFEYVDPTDGSKTSNQGQVITFSDGSRVVFRLSGTGSQGATVRMYVERYVPADAGAGELSRETGDGLKGLIEVALELSKLKAFLGTDQPTVITVRNIVTTSMFEGLKMTFNSKSCSGWSREPECTE